MKLRELFRREDWKEYLRRVCPQQNSSHVGYDPLEVIVKGIHFGPARGSGLENLNAWFWQELCDEGPSLRKRNLHYVADMHNTRSVPANNPRYVAVLVSIENHLDACTLRYALRDPSGQEDLCEVRMETRLSENDIRSQTLLARQFLADLKKRIPKTYL